MSLHDAMAAACAAVQIATPRYTKPGQWVQCPALGKAASNGSGRVLIFDDGRGGIAWNWITSQQQRFSVNGLAGQDEIKAPARDLEAERRAEQQRQEIEAICQRIVMACKPGQHPYFAAKGFPDAEGLVCDDVAALLPDTATGEAIRHAMPQDEGTLLIVPGRIGKKLVTVQFITAQGEKKNIRGGLMGGACHRIATGRETWVCEGIATAMSVHAALRLLGRSATVLCAFAASNVAKVATAIPGAVLAADNDKPVEALGGLGTGEYYALRSGRKWTMPPQLGDFNDMHKRDGLRAVALHLREVGMG